MKSVVKISWNSGKPVLKLATENGFEYVELEKGKKLEYELTTDRRCTGHFESRGNHVACPDFKQIDSGDQCQECRRKDIYTDWRKGNSTPYDADYSVYLVQSSDNVKVGVTKTSRLQERWLEQGAEYAAETISEVSGDTALEKEKEISDEGISERISKSKKSGESDPTRLRSTLEKLGFDAEIQNIAESINCELKRKGRFPSPVEKVKGQIVSNGRYGLILGSGKVLKKPEQRGLADY